VVAPEFARLFRGLGAQALLGEARRMGYHTACSRLNALSAWKALPRRRLPRPGTCWARPRGHSCGWAARSTPLWD